jgi:integrase
MGVADARKAATEALGRIELGEDPAAAKKATKRARIEAELSERDKIKTLVNLYAERHLSRIKTGGEVKRSLEYNVLPAWGERKLQDIRRRDVIDLLEEIAQSGRATTANRVRAYLSKFFGWCVDREVIENSPAIGVKAVAKEKSRARVLTDDELRWFLAACEDLRQPWGPLGKVLVLTGQRLGEVVGMTDAEIEGDVWRLPAERTKNGRPHDVPLSDTVLEVLSSMMRLGNAGLYHTTNGAMPLSGYFKGRNAIAQRMVEIASEDCGGPVEIPHWTFHDLRRTAATGMARLEIPVRVTEAVLNHVSGTGGGIVAVYQRHDFAREKRHALEAWARFLKEIVESHPGNRTKMESTP